MVLHKTDPNMMCGIGPFKPSWLQRFVKMGAFVAVYSVSGLMTSVLSMYMVSQITTLEKQFGFNSQQSGWLLSCNDIGFLLTTLLASYIAQKVHIPRTLWMCTMFYGISGLMCALAYFISKDAIHGQPVQVGTGNSSVPKARIFKEADLCVADALNTSECDVGSTAPRAVGVGIPSEYSRMAIGLIAAGMVLQGLAKAPRYPFITSYIDDNGKKKNTPMYMGMIMGISIFGPAVAFAIGGVFSRIYVTLEDVTITPRHPSWIGAWWLGFLVFGAISIVTSFPLLCFPRRMKDKPKRKKTETAGTSGKGAVKFHILAFLKTLLRLLTNPLYILLLISNIIGSFVLSGSIAFSAKYIETQFYLPAWKANILLGVVTIVSASLGTMVGGCFVTKRKLTPLGCIKMALVLCILSGGINSLGYVFGCPSPELVGKNIGLPPQDSASSCGGMCHCDSSQYFPVCGSDDRNYLSPCVAGCTDMKRSGRSQLFDGCDCIGLNATATAGLCDTDCKMLYPYLVMSVFSAFIGTMGIMPSFIIAIRCVSEEDKAMSIGFSSLMGTLLGWFPGPVVYGRVVDAACLIWATSCSKTGACSLYDNTTFRLSKVSMDLVPKAVSIILYTLIFFKAKGKNNWSVENVERDGTGSGGQELIVNGDVPVDDVPLETIKSPIVNSNHSNDTK